VGVRDNPLNSVPVVPDEETAMKPYSIDLRQRIVKRYLDGGVTQAQVAELFSVSERTVSEFVRRHRSNESLQPKPHGGGPVPKLDAAAREKLRRYVQDQPDATLEDLRGHLGDVVSVPTVHRVLRNMGARLKKNSSRQ
jgi:transposase